MNKVIACLRYVLSIHLLALLFFMLFRIVLYFTNIEQVGDVEGKGYLFFISCIKGLQFDNFIASYISIIPLLLLSIFALYKRIVKGLVIGCNVFFIVSYTIIFTISIADIPYFASFFSHIGVAAFGWFEFGTTTTDLIFGEKSHYPYFALALISVLLFSFATIYFGKKLIQTQTTDIKKKEYKIYIPIVLLLVCACFLGMRGSFQRYPLRVGYAYFSNNSFFNQLGVNPAFYLLKSYSGASKQRNNVNDLMSVKDAFLLVQEELNVDPDNIEEDHPIFREIQPEGEPKDANIVIIFLESMSANNLDREYKGRKLTSFLNELISQSYYFENFYSSGVHTNNGIVSTLYGFPALFNRPMMGVENAHYSGLPHFLGEQGYQTLFFLTSNPNYDHMNAFLSDNSFNRIYSQYDYPNEKIANNFGVQDDYLFEYGIERLNEAALKNKPFLATFLTVSNHLPYVVPDSFKDAGETDEERIIAFADNSLKVFMENAAKTSWYKNTVFVILGDHGAIIGKQKYDMPISHNHVPFILFSPLFDDMPKRLKQYGGQIDIFPTIMGILNRPYVNNSLGVDLLKEERPCMFFASDKKLGCINDDYFYVRNLTTNLDFLYNRHNEQAENLAEKYPEVVKRLKSYAVSMMVVADDLMKSKKSK